MSTAVPNNMAMRDVICTFLLSDWGDLCRRLEEDSPSYTSVFHRHPEFQAPELPVFYQMSSFLLSEEISRLRPPTVRNSTGEPETSTVLAITPNHAGKRSRL